MLYGRDVYALFFSRYIEQKLHYSESKKNESIRADSSEQNVQTTVRQLLKEHYD